MRKTINAKNRSKVEISFLKGGFKSVDYETSDSPSIEIEFVSPSL